ncbi:MAG: BlaI/MecI/CopY family transcriptional regulator [Verrucomicrobiota bacterium]
MSTAQSSATSPKHLPKLSEAEWQVMRAIWDYGPASAKAISELLRRDGVEIDHESVKTYLARLCKKEAISFFRQGKAYCYYSDTNQEAMVREAAKTFWSKIPQASKSHALMELCSFRNELPEEELSEVIDLLTREDKPAESVDSE